MALATTTIKYILLLLNLACSIFGVILIGFGIYNLVGDATSTMVHGEKLVSGLMIALGMILTGIAIFGCYGLMRESRFMIVIYLVILVVVLLVQLILLSMVKQGSSDGLSGGVQQGFRTLWDEEINKPGSLAFYEDWLHCCGVNGTQDYRNIGRSVPLACCQEHNCSTQHNIYESGCENKFKDYLANNVFIFVIISWILILIEVTSVIFGIILWNSWKNNNRRSNIGWS